MMRTIDDIKQAAYRGGSHWFDPGTMRFFASRVSSHVFIVDERRTLFVSSEDSGIGGRRYSVRLAVTGTDTRESDGREILTFRVETLGDFQGYGKRETALRKAKMWQDVLKSA